MGRCTITAGRAILHIRVSSQETLMARGITRNLGAPDGRISEGPSKADNEKFGWAYIGHIVLGQCKLLPGRVQ